MEKRNSVPTVVVGEDTVEDGYFRSLGEDYACIIQVNLPENRVEALHFHPGVQQKYGSIVYETEDYQQMMLKFVTRHADPAERARLLYALSPEHLGKYLESHKALLCQCHEQRQDTRLCHRIKAAFLENSRTQAVLGIVYGQDAGETCKYTPPWENRLLVVEEPELAEMLRPDYQVEEAASAEAAEAMLKGTDAGYAAVVTCRNNGLLQAIRADARCCLMPVIVTAESGAESQCLAEGASELLLKPYCPDVVRNRVRGLVSLQDYSAMVQMLERDPLTGMYTKEFFFQNAQQLRRERPGEKYILACICINNYCAIEEKYGEHLRDSVAEYCARQIEKWVPGLAIAGRLSEETFVVLCHDFPAAERDGVLRQLRHQAPVPNLVVKIGYVPVDDHTSLRVLCDHAQCVTNKIRQMYGVYFGEYTDTLRLEELKEQRILDSMEKALEQHQFQVYYQPKHLSIGGAPVGAEALVRWNHPEYGFMNPGEFIPLFERIGFIRDLDDYVWTQVCQDINRWKAKGLPLVPVSINLSRRDFENPNLADRIMELIQENGIEPELIHIELTESAFSDDPKRISDCLETLHRQRIVIELDDFGAGYSSLTTLNSLDLDILKIDMSIIRQDDPGAQRNALEFCVELAKMMNLKTVAEGIETEQQLVRVRSLGCDYIQGYFYSRPIPEAEFEEYLIRYAEKRP